jgi:uncharacterized membrane protein HdeD (DUF308 family)
MSSYCWPLKECFNLTDVVEKSLRRIGITVSKPILAVICIIFGVLVIVYPWLVAVLVGAFFIIEGALLLSEYYELQSQQSAQPKS